MARSINSPGVQITETDLSNYQQIAGGTTVFVPGFAKQGPTDEVLLITSASELEQVYGTPSTPAEKYFYYTAKEVLNSPAALLTTRLPYGLSSGTGFTNQYSALLYPVASGTNNFSIGQPTHIPLNDSQYNKLVQNNFTWSSLTSATPTLSGSFDGTTLNAGIVIINNAQTTQNEKFEGYYINLADNTGFGGSTDFDAVTEFKGLTGTGDFYTVPSTRVGFALSGTLANIGSNSISETIEFSTQLPFNNSSYKDSLVLSVFKIRNSIYEPELLTFTLQESYVGSLDSNRFTTEGATFSLQSKVNASSQNLRILLNPNISDKTNWSSLTSGDPSTSVTVNSNNKALYPVGVYLPEYEFSTSKEIGSVNLKIERALSLVDSTETIDIDVVTDAGLSTIFATASGVALRPAI